jgi:hypothetical protein
MGGWMDMRSFSWLARLPMARMDFIQETELNGDMLLLLALVVSILSLHLVLEVDTMGCLLA